MYNNARMPAKLVALPSILVLVLAQGVSGQQPAPAQSRAVAQAAARKAAIATRITQPPSIDGALDDASWQQATALEDFTQAEPFEGESATERTEVRLIFDDANLYIGVICYDSSPSEIIVSDARRDASMTEMDSFQVIFDTFRDRQNGFIFGTNPAGAQYDAQIRNEGETQSQGRAGPASLTSGGGGGSGAGGGGGGGGGGRSSEGGAMNASWNADWEVKARITEIGWVAEIRIPLRTLRYGSPPQLWGVNFSRNIRRKREQAYWSPISRAYTISRLSSAGDLRGLDLRTPRNLKISPYAIAAANRVYANRTPTNDVTKDWGLDAKYSVTPTLNLDLTYNTDFAQVEADQQQINLTRFNLVFPEKRPFFLENAGLFSVGNGSDVSLFYSRRIGISDDGGLVPITGGARLSGKAAGVNVGFLNMQTQSMVDANGVLTTPANNWTAARVTRELPNRSYIGGVFTNRSATGRGTGPNDWGRTYGIDGKWGITPNLTFGGFAAATETPGITGRRQHAFESTLNYNASLRRDYIGYTEVADGFNPEAGFLQRAGGYRGLSAGWHEQWRWKSLRDKGFRELSPHMTFVRYWNYDDGGLLTSTLHIDNHLDWENGYYFSPAVNIDWDGLDEPFEIYPGVIVPAGRYTEPHTAWRFNTDAKKSLWFSTQWQYGGFLSGRQNSMAPALNFRQGANLVTALTWTRNDINLPQGAFVTNLGNLRMTYNFSTTQFVQALVQYNDRTNRWSTNLRFNWIDSAGTGLFLVYNDTESMNGLGALNRAFIVKFSRQVDILR